MKIIRWAAAAALTLISLLNIGVALGGDGTTPIAVRVLVPMLGVLGLIAAYGLVRRRRWGQRSALGVGAINLISAIAAVALNSGGAALGLAVSAIALALAALTSYRGRDRHPEASSI